MTDINFEEIFTLKILSRLFPGERVDNFFDWRDKWIERWGKERGM